MAIRILHAADFHMDSPYGALPESMAAERRREMRALLHRLFRFAADDGAQVILLSGDLLDSSASYHETRDALLGAMAGTEAEIFISPGNHDYYCPSSPYAYLEFPKNVHIFRFPRIESVDLPALGVRVYGAGFNASKCGPLLTGFSAAQDAMINIMVLHGDTSGGEYNPVLEDDIAKSGLDYLALGHIHKFSGIKKAGRTCYAYPGCIEGRGFDEDGEKGFITGTVGKDGCALRFIPAGGREYHIRKIDLTGRSDAAAAILENLPENAGRDVYRLIMTGEFSGGINPDKLQSLIAGSFYRAAVRDETYLPRDIWAGAEEDTLTGGFLRRLRAEFEAAPDEEKRLMTMAVRYGLAALEKREEWQP
ncbi:MAG: DNA repair exonuclease [Clostridia bacterium]|nr:DNA repair exonuclease [Clostridia bacterium]